MLQGFRDRKMGSSTLRAELSFRHAFYFVRDVRVADIPVAWLAYVRTYCVPIATLNHSKRSRLLEYKTVKLPYRLQIDPKSVVNFQAFCMAKLTKFS